MSYIGSKPANKPVVASDIDPTVITGQTALAVAPADTDEFLISDAGTLKRLDASLIGGGKVLQVVTATDSTQRSTTSTSFASMTLNATITPAATSSKVLVLVQAAMGMNQEAYTYFDIQKSVDGGSYTSLGGSSGFGTTRITSAHLILTPSALMTLNSPSSTSALTYQVYAKVVNSEDTAYFGDGGISTMVLMEIGA